MINNTTKNRMGYTLYKDLYMFPFYVLLYINIRCDDRSTLHGWPLAVD